MDCRFDRAIACLGDDPVIPLNTRVPDSIFVTVGDDIHHKRQTLKDVLEETILPIDNVYLQSKYRVFLGPKQKYEEI